MMMMVPEAFGPKYHISTDKRAFYEYHASIMEPWDGPAAIVFTDGRIVGGTLGCQAYVRLPFSYHSDPHLSRSTDGTRLSEKA